MGVIHVRRPIATVRIELAPCFGLDSDGVGSGHFRLLVVPLIIMARIDDFLPLVDAFLNCPLDGRDGME